MCSTHDTQTFVVIHVDECLCVGPLEELELLHVSLKKVNTMFRGVQQVNYSNRAIRRKKGGISWESDPKHMVALKEEHGMQQCCPAPTPIAKDGGSRVRGGGGGVSWGLREIEARAVASQS